jgi:ABC-type antimicrobial peptide transport system permease subunit
MKIKKEHPPRSAGWILSHLKNYEYDFSISGDFDEEFREIARRKGRFLAHLWYWWQVLYSVPAYLNLSILMGAVMFKNYMKTAFRNMKKHKGFAIINIAGLAIGLTICFFILLWVQHELSYDQYHKNAENIYRINIKIPTATGHRLTSYSAPAIGPALKEEYADVEKSTRFRIVSDKKILVKYGQKHFFEEKFGFADPDILDMFTVIFVKGDPKTALINPDSIVITEDFAKRYFGDDEPLGKILNVEKDHDFTVTGIIKNIPRNSHLRYDSLVPFEPNIQEFMRTYGYPKTFDIHFFRNYLLLQENTSPEEFGEKIYSFLNTKIEDSTYKLVLQPIKKIHLYSSHVRDLFSRGNIQYVYTFSLIGFLVLIIACINFINLTTARSGFRTKEVGVRKVIGAVKKDLVWQFFGESLLYTLFAFFLSGCLVLLFLPAFRSLIGNQISLELVKNWKLIGGIFAITITAGIISGSYPALFLSSFKPVKVLKGTFASTKGKGLFRKVLVVTQFVIAIGLINCTIIILFQFRYLQERNLGFDKNQMVYIRLHGELREKHEILRTELLKNPSIEHAAITSSILTQGRYVTTVFNWDGKDPEIENASSRADYVSVDENFIDTFGMELIQGRNFSPLAQKKPMQEIIINESTLKMMGVESPLGLGADLTDNDFRAKIIGVVKDYHFKSLHNEISPLVLWVNPWLFKYVFIKVNPENMNDTLKYAENKCRQIEPGFPFEYHFLDEAFGNLYTAEEKMGRVFNVFTILAIFIACLGLFGLSAFTAEVRTKEIGIRKILGASIPNIVKLISKEFVLLVSLSNIIAWPVVYYLMTKWLQNFAYQDTIHIWTFAASGFLILNIALFTVSFHSIRTATANPADSLRYE